VETSVTVARIRQICQDIPPAVRVVAVTKTVPVDGLRQAYAAGIRDFGENRVQEAIAKQTQLADLTDVTWHLIGHLQSNKARKALEHFHWIQSVDRLSLADRLNHLAEELGKTPQICIQVKLRPDPTKGGWTVPQLREDLPALGQLTHLQFRGVMVIPPAHLPDTEILKIFEEAQIVRQELQNYWSNLKHRSDSWEHLSMGMSGDYPLALAAGSTMVRLGSILFGDRSL
jgi:PLP dependent protein